MSRMEDCCYKEQECWCKQCEYQRPENMPCDSMLPGGWSAFRKLRPQEKRLFYEATRTVMGATYRPLVVSTQTVAGTNYLFLAEMKVITATDCYTDLVTVSIFRALNGAVTLGEIKSIRPQ